MRGRPTCAPGPRPASSRGPAWRRRGSTPEIPLRNPDRPLAAPPRGSRGGPPATHHSGGPGSRPPFRDRSGSSAGSRAPAPGSGRTGRRSRIPLEHWGRGEESRLQNRLGRSLAGRRPWERDLTEGEVSRETGEGEGVEPGWGGVPPTRDGRDFGDNRGTSGSGSLVSAV